MPTVYYLLPIYNEAAQIALLIDALTRIPLPADYHSRIVAVNDGSTDGTLAILEAVKENHSLEIVSYAPNRGIPTVLTRGFAHLLSRLNDDDIVIIMESDGTSDLSVVPQFVERIQMGADIVIGSRSRPGGAYLHFPLQRKIGSIITNLFLRTLWRVPNVRDYTIFYRAYRGRVLKTFLQPGLSFQSQRSFAANGELLLQLSTQTKNIVEVPLRYDYSLKKGKSKMKLFETLWEYLKIRRP